MNPSSEIIFGRKVDASKLTINKSPLNLKSHSKLPTNDKAIWDSEYTEEYYGLHESSIAWEYIIEEQYQLLLTYTGSAVPTQALAVIKTDENGKPTRVKCRFFCIRKLRHT